MTTPKTIPLSHDFVMGRCWQYSGFVLLAGALLWAYWPTFTLMVGEWSVNPQYSHGWLVPAFAVILLWVRRRSLPAAWPPANWWGAALMAFGVLLRCLGSYLYLSWFDAISLLPLLAGMSLLVGGTSALRWAWPAIGFLFFMIPLPYRIETAMAYPLRRFATVTSAYVLQTLGLPAVAEGNVIYLNQIKIGVVEACSGLSMLMVFFALATAVILLARRPLWEQVVILLTSVPIALIANVIRISLTGVLHVAVSHEAADLFFHDLAGWLMMPLAVVMLWLVLLYLTRVMIDPVAAGRSGGPVHPGVSPAIRPLVSQSHP